jgi:ATP-binding cassette subfamily B (MDR/TAP) protein 6
VKQRSGSTFAGLGQKIKLIWTSIWPAGEPELQLRVFICAATLVGARLVNLYVPLSYKKVVDALGGAGAPVNGEHVPFPVNDILFYVFLRLLQGGGIGSMGLLSNIRSYLWIKVQQFTNRSVRVKVSERTQR